MLCPNCASDNIPGIELCESCGTDLAGLDLPEARSGFRGKLLTSRVGDLPVSPAVVVAPDQTVREAIERMREAQAGCVVVQRDGKLLGLFNERHVLTRVLRAGLDPSATEVSAVMSPDPVELSPDDPPAYAIYCMVANDFRHLPLVDDSGVLGYVAVRNIVRFLNDDVLGGHAGSG